MDLSEIKDSKCSNFKSELEKITGDSYFDFILNRPDFVVSDFMNVGLHFAYHSAHEINLPEYVGRANFNGTYADVDRDAREKFVAYVKEKHPEFEMIVNYRMAISHTAAPYIKPPLEPKNQNKGDDTFCRYDFFFSITGTAIVPKVKPKV